MRFSATIAALAVLGFALTNCTKYQPDTIGGGFSEIPLAANAYRVETRGNAYASPALVREITLVRGAVLTLDNGFQRFLVLDQADWEKIDTSMLPGTYQSNTTVYGTMTGNSLYGSGSTFGTYTPPQTITYRKPRNAMVIYMLKEPPANPARFISRHLRHQPLLDRGAGTETTARA